MEKFFVLSGFVIVVVALILAYERPTKKREKMTGRGGDFES
jgi:peptidoglycan/LPS O-acetylase OafA/YrhL